MFAPSPIATAPAYHRHRPEQTALYAIIAEHYLRFVQEIERSGECLPKFVRQEFEEYLKCGLLIADPVGPYLDLAPGSSLAQLQAASIAYRIAIGPRAGRKALTLYSVPPLDESPDRPRLAQVAGFSLHAATVCEAWQRSRLERLCHYISRPPLATRRLSVDDQGRVVNRYKQPFRDGSTHVVPEPLDFLARLAARVPRPRLNLTRFHSLFAPNFKHRSRIVPRRARGTVDSDKPLAPMSWAQRLRRVFAIDIGSHGQPAQRGVRLRPEIRAIRAPRALLQQTSQRLSEWFIGREATHLGRSFHHRYLPEFQKAWFMVPIRLMSGPDSYPAVNSPSFCSRTEAAN